MPAGWCSAGARSGARSPSTRPAAEANSARTVGAGGPASNRPGSSIWSSGTAIGVILATDSGKRWKVEDRLDQAFATLDVEIDKAAARDAAWAEQKRLEEEARQRRLEQEAAEALALRRHDHLMELVARNQHADLIREFVADLRKRSDLTQEQHEWLDWAVTEAARLEPTPADLAHPPKPEPRFGIGHFGRT